VTIDERGVRGLWCDALGQALWAARRTRNLLASKGVRAEVIPVLVLWGPKVARVDGGYQRIGDVRVVVRRAGVGRRVDRAHLSARIGGRRAGWHERRLAACAGSARAALVPHAHRDGVMSETESARPADRAEPAALASRPPDREAMRARYDAAIYAALEGGPLTPAQELIVQLHYDAGGCHSCARS
jgi:hypothetical protein